MSERSFEIHHSHRDVTGGWLRPAVFGASDGLVSNFALIAGVAGPLLDVFFVRSTIDRRAVVATKAATQAISHTLKVGYYGV